MKLCPIGVTLATALLGPLLAQAQTGPPATPRYPVTQGKSYKFEKVAEGVYYASGGVGGNHPIFVNDRDVVLVDTGSTPATALDLLEDLKLITDKPVGTVINTHFHYDHTDGNSIFAPNIPIIGHEAVRQAILTSNVLENEPYRTSQKTRVAGLLVSLPKQIANEKDPAQKKILEAQLLDAQVFEKQLREIRPTPPNITYTSKMVLYRGQQEIQLLFLGRGHTDGDTFVYLPKERIVCTGDMMVSQVAFMGNGFFDEWIDTLGTLKRMNIDLILPGHGRPFSDKALITAFQGYLTDLMKQVVDFRKQGISADEAARRVDLTAYEKYFPNIHGVGADLRGVRRVYEWMDERENK